MHVFLAASQAALIDADTSISASYRPGGGHVTEE